MDLDLYEYGLRKRAEFHKGADYAFAVITTALLLVAYFLL